MEGRIIYRNADDDSSHPKGSSYQREPLTNEQRKEKLLSKISSSSFPLALTLKNLSFQLTESLLLSELGLSSGSTVAFIEEEGKFSGTATLTVDTYEDALILAEKANTEVSGRLLFVNFPYTKREGDSSKRGERGRGRGRRGGRNTGSWRNTEERQPNNEERKDNKPREPKQDNNGSSYELKVSGSKVAVDSFFKKIKELATDMNLKLDLKRNIID